MVARPRVNKGTISSLDTEAISGEDMGISRTGVVMVVIETGLFDSSLQLLYDMYGLDRR